MEIILYTGTVILASIAVWKGSGLLENASAALASYYGLPPMVQGGILVAVGSSFPELSTVVISTLLHGEFDLGVSAIIGSAIFNILVIPGLSATIGERMKVDRTLLHKEAQFYLTAVAMILLTFALAVMYFPVEGESQTMRGSMTRLLAAIPLILYLFYVFLQREETKEHTGRKIQETGIAKQWLRLIAGLVLIVFSVEGLVRGAIFFGEYFHTPNFIWGVTVIAAATSIPDTLVSIRLATGRKSLVSLANVFGSNTFDLLVAVPAGVMIAGSSVVNFSIALPLMLFLCVATVVLFVFLRTKLSLGIREGVVLLVCYGIFVLWMILETAGILGYVIG